MYAALTVECFRCGVFFFLLCFLIFVLYGSRTTLHFLVLGKAHSKRLQIVWLKKEREKELSDNAQLINVLVWEMIYRFVSMLLFFLTTMGPSQCLLKSVGKFLMISMDAASDSLFLKILPST